MTQQEIKDAGFHSFDEELKPEPMQRIEILNKYSPPDDLDIDDTYYMPFLDFSLYTGWRYSVGDLS